MTEPVVLYTVVYSERVRQRADDFDFLHFHLDYYPFSLFSRQATPFVTTLHGRLDLPEHQPVFTAFSSLPVISISNAQRRPVAHAGWLRTVYHGLPQQLLKRLPHPFFARYLRHLAGVSYIFVCVSAKNIDDAKAILENGGAQVAHNRYFSFTDAPLVGEQTVSSNRWHE